MGALQLVKLIASESLTGIWIGVLGRIFFLALETLANGIAMSIGLTSNMGAPIDENEPLPALSTLFTFAATMLLFASDLHWELIRALAGSYTAMPVESGFQPQTALVQLGNVLSRSFLISLQVASPFIMYGLLVNFAFGLVNKMVPQVPVYFISMPFIVAGGILLVYLTIREALLLFHTGFAAWLIAGS